MYLLMDIGGTRMRFALAEKTKIKKTLVYETPKDFKTALKTFESVKLWLGVNKPTKIVCGLPRFNKNKLTYWFTNPTKQKLEKIFKCKAVLENDAALAGVAEAIYGSGKNHSIIAYITVSTGLGGAKIVDKKIDPNSLGFEPKLEVVSYNSKTDKDTSISKMITGRGIKQRYHVLSENLKNKKAWKNIENWLGEVLINTGTFWSPEVIILGGPVALNQNISFGRLQKKLNLRFKGMPKTPRLVRAKLSQQAGLLGALVIANKK